MQYLSDIAEEDFTWCFVKPTGIALGLLYNYYVVDHGFIAPTGWHVPTYAEWTTLVTTIGGIDSLQTLLCTGSDYWITDGGTDDYGFKGRGSGMRYLNGDFDLVKMGLYCWSSDLYTVPVPFPFGGFNSNAGLAIRLLKDDATNPGTLTDIDGNIYPTVKIGSQVWTAENLAVTSYTDGTAIPEVQNSSDWAKLTTGALCAYNNNWDNAVS